jgi:hypothetical protein
MKRALLAAAVTVMLAAGLAAQRAGDNINVLPIVPGDPLKGDLYLQRQVEPTIVASTRNPNHLAAFYIDYRTVDTADDVNIGEDGPRTTDGMCGTLKGWLARLVGNPTSDRRALIAAAPGEANIGYSRSRDGGLTWSGALLPGLSYDNVPSPIKTFAATTDPVAVAGPCGSIYLAFIAFNRNANSALVITKFADLDNSTGNDHTIVYKGMSVVETGSNATYGYFNDKPDLEIDLDRTKTVRCGHRLFASYSVFNGLSKTVKFQTKVKVATLPFGDDKSSLEGVTAWTTTEISGPYTQNQGTAMAVDPVNGDLYVFWRHFNSPDVMVFATPAGARLSDLGWTPKQIKVDMLKALGVARSVLPLSSSRQITTPFLHSSSTCDLAIRSDPTIVADGDLS